MDTISIISIYFLQLYTIVSLILNVISKKMNTGFHICLLLISWTSSICAQSKFFKNIYVRADVNYGLIIPEYKHFLYLVDKPIVGTEFSIAKKTTGKTIWEQSYKYPEFGLTFLYTTLGNQKVFGNEIAVFPYVQSFLIRKERFQLTNQFGFGIGYATKKFDLETNYQNISVGSHLNIHFNYKLGTRFKLTDKFSINAGLAFSHYSNANMAEPNLGVNLFTAFTGINYTPGAKTEFIKSEWAAHEKQHEFAFVYALGGKHTRALQSTVYITSSLSTEYKFHWKRKIHIGGGLDLFYDSSTEAEMGSPGKSEYKPIYEFRTGVHFSQELVYDKFSFILQEGIYVGLTDRVDNKRMYNRGIIRWKFNDHFMMHISMKSHLHILDYPELGFAYFFIHKK